MGFSRVQWDLMGFNGDLMGLNMDVINQQLHGSQRNMGRSWQHEYLVGVYIAILRMHWGLPTKNWCDTIPYEGEIGYPMGHR